MPPRPSSASLPALTNALEERGVQRVGAFLEPACGHQERIAAQSPRASDPARVLTGLNQALSGKFQWHFVTAGYLFLDLENSTVNYAGAAHPPLLLWRKKSGSATEVLENGLMLGLLPDSTYSAITLPLECGDWIVLFTDGIVEARNPSGEEFGMDRLKRFVEENRALSAERLGDGLLDALEGWSGQPRGEGQADDITLLAIHFKA